MFTVTTIMLNDLSLIAFWGANSLLEQQNVIWIPSFFCHLEVTITLITMTCIHLTAVSF